MCAGHEDEDLPTCYSAFHVSLVLLTRLSCIPDDPRGCAPRRSSPRSQVCKFLVIIRIHTTLLLLFPNRSAVAVAVACERPGSGTLLRLQGDGLGRGTRHVAIGFVILEQNVIKGHVYHGTGFLCSGTTGDGFHSESYRSSGCQRSLGTFFARLPSTQHIRRLFFPSPHQPCDSPGSWHATFHSPRSFVHLKFAVRGYLSVGHACADTALCSFPISSRFRPLVRPINASFWHAFLWSTYPRPTDYCAYSRDVLLLRLHSGCFQTLLGREMVHLVTVSGTAASRRLFPCMCGHKIRCEIRYPPSQVQVRRLHGRISAP